MAVCLQGLALVLWVWLARLPANKQTLGMSCAWPLADNGMHAVASQCVEGVLPQGQVHKQAPCLIILCTAVGL